MILESHRRQYSESSESDIDHEAYCWLRSVVDELPESYREAIRLTEYEGITQREMAHQLGISFSGAKSRVQRARSKLKTKLQECCHFELDLLGNVMDCQHKGIECECQPPSEMRIHASISASPG